MAARQWYYQLMGEVVGPLSADELKEHAADGQIERDTLVRKGDDGAWLLADKVQGLLDKTKQAAVKTSPVLPPRVKSLPPRVEKSADPNDSEQKRLGEPSRLPNRQMAVIGGGILLVVVIVVSVVSMKPQTPTTSQPSAVSANNSPATKSEETTPVDSFKAFAKDVVAAEKKRAEKEVPVLKTLWKMKMINRQMEAVGSTEIRGITAPPPEPVAIEVSDDYDIDVRKSDSLIAPYVGELRIKERLVSHHNDIVSGNYAGDWKLVMIQARYEDNNWKSLGETRQRLD
jgi:GYF domain 2